MAKTETAAARTEGTDTKKTDTKGRIIAAAEEVVLRDGVARLTLEAAAAEAGLSKGGVLYHFPTRDALVAGMVGKIIDEFDRDIEADHPGRGPGRFTRAYIRATMAPAIPAPDRQDRLGAALIAAAAAEPTLLAPLQRAADRWQARLVDDGLDPVATVLRLACDGSGCATCSDWRHRPPPSERRSPPNSSARPHRLRDRRPHRHP
jgi:AcrR family transcriptional regulator